MTTIERQPSAVKFDAYKDTVVEPQALRFYSEQEMTEFVEKLNLKAQALREETDLFRRYTDRTTQGKGFKAKEKDNTLIGPKDSVVEPEQPLVLSFEQKGDIASHEADELKQELIRIGEKAKTYSDKYECKIKECEQFKEFVDSQDKYFRHKVMQDGTVSAERLFKWLEDSVKNLESMYRSNILSNSANMNSTKALQTTLHKQEELGENLTQVDFMKVEIENMLLVQACEKCKEEIQETNRENNRTSLATASLSQQAIDLSKFIQDGQSKLQAEASTISKLDKERDSIDEVKQRLHGWNKFAKDRNFRCPSVNVYVQVEKDIELLDQLKKEATRKMQIIEMSGRLRSKAIGSKRYYDKVRMNPGGLQKVDGIDLHNYEIPIMRRNHLDQTFGCSTAYQPSPPTVA